MKLLEFEAKYTKQINKLAKLMVKYNCVFNIVPKDLAKAIKKLKKKNKCTPIS